MLIPINSTIFATQLWIYMDRIINKDYIAYLTFSDGHCTYHEVNISHPHQYLIEKVQMMSERGWDYLSIVDTINDCFPKDRVKEYQYRYCYPYRYDDRLYSDAEYPAATTDGALTSIKEKIIKDAKYELGLLRICRVTSAQDRARISELEEILKNPEQKAIEDMIERFMRWIYANDYYTTLDGILANHPDCIYSHDAHGFISYAGFDTNGLYWLSEDLTFTFKTNFAFGNSSVFFVNFSYKGISLLPYSTLVNYYYANIEELVRYTRSYKPMRENWPDALQEIQHFANEATANPDSFFKQWMSNELDEMMFALERFMVNPHGAITSMIKHPGNGNNKYLTIRNASSVDIEEFDLEPHRVELLFKADKVTGALHFIDSIKKVAVHYTPACGYVNRLLSMNNQLFDELYAEMNIVEERVAHLANLEIGKDELAKMRTDLLSYQRQLSKYVLIILDSWYQNCVPAGTFMWLPKMKCQEKISIFNSYRNQYKLA